MLCVCEAEVIAAGKIDEAVAVVVGVSADSIYADSGGKGVVAGDSSVKITHDEDHVVTWLTLNGEVKFVVEVVLICVVAHVSRGVYVNDVYVAC